MDATDNQNWKVTLNALEAKYNKKRWEFCEKVNRYGRQNAYSSIVEESELMLELEELKSLRNKMHEVRNLITKNKNYAANDVQYINRIC